MELLLKLIKGETITNDDIADELYEMCDRVHASCDSECLVYHLNGNKIPHSGNGSFGCDHFKDGMSMLNFIEKKLKI